MDRVGDLLVADHHVAALALLEFQALVNQLLGHLRLQPPLRLRRRTDA
jgi:hypothetical protein